MFGALVAHQWPHLQEGCSLTLIFPPSHYICAGLYDYNKDDFDLIPVTATGKTTMSLASKILESIQLNIIFSFAFLQN